MKTINSDDTHKHYERIWGGLPDDNEMGKLIILLAQAGIPFDLNILFGRPQVLYPSAEYTVCDAVCHWGSYGHERGLIEIMGLVETLEDDVEGYLTAEEVFRRIKKDYEKTLDRRK